ncbi:PKD domain-containing protein [Mucilaginibacter litoreus]|uniref:PKD domain-containing protein n=1 Tax=Mucilaginibacter litoreus TaxID=1048221 RepID=A0ABW3AUH7_9SPHI
MFNRLKPYSQRFLLLLALLIATARNTAGQTVSNAGTDFWTAFPSHVPDHNPDGSLGLPNFSIFITSSAASSGTVTAGSFSQHFSVSANAVAEISVPRNGIYIDETETNRVLIKRGIHIVTDPGQPPIVAYAHIFAAQRSAATLLLPTTALGQQYYSINYAQHREGKNFMLLVATEANTRIRIQTPYGELVPGGVFLPNPGDVYELADDFELTGFVATVDAETSACKHFALFSGSSGTPVGQNCDYTGTLDPLFQQTLPVESWGYNYGFVPFSTFSPNTKNPVRTAGQRVKVVAKENNTIVKIGGKDVDTLNAGEYYTTYVALKTATLVQASKPVEVAQYALSQECAMDPAQGSKYLCYSDPDMVILNPVEYRIKDITLFSSEREHIAEQYINVFMKTAAAPSFRINGQLPSTPFTPVNGSPEYAYLQLNVDGSKNNTFHLEADDGFNAVAYGFGNYESYAYSAGTNLAANQSLTAVRTATGETIDSACVNESYYFRLTLPYRSPEITWQADLSEPPLHLQNPPFTTQIINGTPVYLYTLQRSAAYNLAGTRHFKAIAAYPASMGGCANGTQTIEGDFKVLPSPAPDFSFEAGSCDNQYLFHDLSAAEDHPSSWSWNFGDPGSLGENISDQQNPTHRFSAAGIYQVSLTTTGSGGCQGSKTITVTVSQSISPGILSPATACQGMPVQLADTSHSAGFAIKSRHWQFGDGSTVYTSGDSAVSHTYTKPGIFTIKMVLQSKAGCFSDTASRTIKIAQATKADFSSSVSCAADMSTHFNNLSSGVMLRFNWQFGDAAAAATDNESTLAAPSHNYSAAGNYTVRLIATNDNGCSDTLTKKISVNGIEPKADFVFIGGNAICSGQVLRVQNLSHMTDFGAIDRLVWVFDAVHHPADRQSVDPAAAGNVFATVYPETNTTETYQIRLLAYSGASCVDSTEKTVTVLPRPHAALKTIAPVCLNTGSFSLVEKDGTNPQTGTWKFTGPGIDNKGMFNPVLAGVGVHTVTCIFTNISGCTDTATNAITVLRGPVAQLQPVLTINAGEGIFLNPSGKQDGLSYEWTPSVGLNSALSANPYATPKETITYHYRISDGNCDAQGIVQVNVRLQIEVTNTFTPNSDGVNDFLQVKHAELYPGAQLFIYNRWGMEVFHSRGYDKPWDGTLNGNPLATGVYYYVIRIPGRRKPLSGNITLLR